MSDQRTIPTDPRDRCNEPVPAWQFVRPMRCNLERGHALECTHLPAAPTPSEGSPTE